VAAEGSPAELKTRFGASDLRLTVPVAVSLTRLAEEISGYGGGPGPVAGRAPRTGFSRAAAARGWSPRLVPGALDAAGLAGRRRHRGPAAFSG